MQNINTPTLLLNCPSAQANIRRMVDKAERHGLQLRPHFKTIQCHHIARYFRELGVKTCTVSSLSMAEYFAADSWDDITVAFPVNLREMEIINELAAKISLNLLVVNSESTIVLNEKLKHAVGIFIKIDVGAGRTGLLPEDENGIENCLNEIGKADKLVFKGFLTHAGHSYRARSNAEVLKVHEETTATLRALKEKYRQRFPHLVISPGDTPTCSLAENWAGIDEIRPGNFPFYDVMQVQIGSCEMKDIAVALACPVVAKHADRQDVIIYGGGVHLSKDRLLWEGQEIYGLPVLLHENGWEMPEDGCFVKSLSQEHGTVHCTPSFFEKLKIGGLVGILPMHSCMMVDIANSYLTTDGQVWEKM